MLWFLDLLKALEGVVRFVSSLLIGFVIVSSLVSAVSFSRSVGDRPWISVAPLVTALLSSATVVAVLLHVEIYATVIQKLGQFSGALDTLAHVHAAIFISLVTVTAARAFYVIGEMDKGRYFGNDDVPRIVAHAGRRRYVEAVVRLIIIVWLALFAANFLSIVWPSETSQLHQTGQPTFIGAYARECERYEESARELGFGTSTTNCVLDRISALPEGELRDLATVVTEPTRAILTLAYLSMILWSAVLWWTAARQVADKRQFRRSVFRQVYIASFSLASLACMALWFYVAVSGERLFQGINSSAGFTSGILSMLSLLGIGCAMASYYHLMRRIVADFKVTSSIARNTLRTFKGEAHGNRSA